MHDDPRLLPPWRGSSLLTTPELKIAKDHCFGFLELIESALLQQHYGDEYFLNSSTPHLLIDLSSICHLNRHSCQHRLIVSN